MADKYPEVRIEIKNANKNNYLGCDYMKHKWKSGGGERGGKVDNKCDLVGNSDINNRTELQSAIQISGFMLLLREGPAIIVQTGLKLVTLLPQPAELWDVPPCQALEAPPFSSKSPMRL